MSNINLFLQMFFFASNKQAMFTWDGSHMIPVQDQTKLSLFKWYHSFYQRLFTWDCSITMATPVPV